MHIVFICLEAILIGAPYAFPSIPPALGTAMFWLGVTGLIVTLCYPALARLRSWQRWFGSADTRWPDFKKWDTRDVFELYEAACSWFDIEPHLPMPDRAKMKYKEWRNEIYAGVTPLASDDRTARDAVELAFERVGLRDARVHVTPHSKIDRDVLIIMAEQEGVQPLFLFPHRRGE
jgi:hypothetical protein